MPENQTAAQDPRDEFINASVWHGSLDRAHEVLAAHPEVASNDIHTAALLGDHEAVARFSPRIWQMPPSRAVRASGTP
jgi:hypothetical protein